jgi:hypothetical protein
MLAPASLDSAPTESVGITGEVKKVPPVSWEKTTFECEFSNFPH